MGDVYADDTTDTDAVIGGNCYIEGNLYTPGAISVTSGGTTDMTCPAGSGGPPWWDVCGNVYSTSTTGVTIGAGFTVQGGIFIRMVPSRCRARLAETFTPREP